MAILTPLRFKNIKAPCSDLSLQKNSLICYAPITIDDNVNVLYDLELKKIELPMKLICNIINDFLNFPLNMLSTVIIPFILDFSSNN